MRFLLRLAPLLVLAPGCGLFAAGHGTTERPGRNPVGVEVESHNWSDITVYLVTDGHSQRLGMVTALSSASFEFPAQRLNAGDVRLRALPVAGRAFTSETILVTPGQVITWRLENDLGASSFSVY